MGTEVVARIVKRARLFSIALLFSLSVLYMGQVSGFPFYGMMVLGPINISGGNFFYTQDGTAWSQGFTASGGTGVFTYSLPTAPGGATVDASGLVSYTPGGFGKYNFTLRATDSQGKIKDHDFVIDVYAAGVCLWTGTSSTSWTTASNWDFCGGVAPTAASNVAIAPDAPNMPVVAANTTVNSFGAGPGGGTVTVNAAISLTITATTNSIRSSVKFQGATTTCTNCNVLGASSLYVVDNAKVTLLKGIQFLYGASILYVGDGVTAGHLATGPAGASSEWPQIGGPGAWMRTVVSGGAGQKSSLDLDGALIKSYDLNADTGLVNLADWYELKKMDNIVMYMGAVTPNKSLLKFSNCTNATVTDATWSNWVIDAPISGVGAYNIDASGVLCSGLPAIAVSNPIGVFGGTGYGADFENDPNAKISWGNSTSMTCTWTGAVNTSWTNPGNWSGCANGRGEYPDQLDYAVVPVTATQPVISNNNTVVGGFGLGAGGGTVTVNAGINFNVAKATSTYRSDIKFQGATNTCTNCNVFGLGNVAITDGATVTLLKGIGFAPRQQSILNVGDGVTHGFLATGPAGPSNEWPYLGTSTNHWNITRVNGSATQKSGLYFDGIHINAFQINTGTAVLDLLDWYEIQKFDNVDMAFTGGGGATNGWSHLKFSSCTNALVTDVNWTGFSVSSQIYSTGYNISATGTDCATLPVITISNAANATGGMGYGSVFEQDPHNKLTWSNESSNVCTWTGATNTDWKLASNWSGCANARGGYPDQIDTVVIPVTANAPIVNTDWTVGGFSTGTGGGVVTIAVNTNLFIQKASSSIRSDVKFQGATTTCANCNIWGLGTSLAVTDNATVTLLKGIAMSVTGVLYFGDGVTAGNLSTGAPGTTAEYPRLGSGGVWMRTVIGGGSPVRSTIDLNGLKIMAYALPFNNSKLVTFNDWLGVTAFDNVVFDVSMPPSGSAVVHFTDCLNSSFTDVSWAGFDFVKTVPAGNYNIDLSAVGCAAVNVETTGAVGLGAGAAYENDPFLILDWN